MMADVLRIEARLLDFHFQVDPLGQASAESYQIQDVSLQIINSLFSGNNLDNCKNS